MSKKTVSRAIFVGAAVLSGALSSNASAQSVEPASGQEGVRTDEEVFVTARRREENIQDVPLAVSVIGGEDLQERGISTGEDLQFNVPSLSTSAARSHNNASYSIRGLGQPLLGATSVANYFSELPSPTVTSSGDAGAGQALYDLASVQVLKGPQGTLFGRSSIGGAVLLTPQHPVYNELSGYVSGGVGSFGAVRADAALNVPVGEHAALRVAVHDEHADGYTEIIGGGEPLDETNNFGARVGFDFNFGPFSNYAAVDVYRVDSSNAGQIASGVWTGAAQLNRTASAFTAICTTAVGYGSGALGAGVVNDTVANCQSQRVAILANIRATMAAEQARLAGGDDAVWESLGNQGLPLIDQSDHITYVDIAQLDLGEFSFGSLSLTNIAGYQLTRQLVSFSGGGIPGLNQSAYGSSAASNQTGNQMIADAGPFNHFYSDELQLNGDLFDNAFVFTLGYFMQRAPVTENFQGVGNLFRQFGGVGVVNLGWSPAGSFNADGRSRQEAWFGQATWDLTSIGLDGVRLTGGYRQTEDEITLQQRAATTAYPSGVLSPGALGAVTRTSTDGEGWTFAIDYRPSEDLTLYATARRGYKPGGINTVVGVPADQVIYAPETVDDIEIGAKWQYDILGVRGHIFADVYRDDYTDIQRSTRFSPSVAYIDNVAGARLQGFEIEASAATDNGWEALGAYSYNNSEYTDWFGADPLRILSTNIDLSNNPFANAPEHKATLTVRHTSTLPDGLGELTLGATLYHQSRVWWDDNAIRTIDVMTASPGPGLSLDYVREAISQSAYTTANLRADWTNFLGSDADLGFFVNNLTDEAYAVGGNASGFYSVGLAQENYAAPRTFGLSFTYHFEH